MRKRAVRSLIVLTGVLAVAGCARMFRAPEVQLQSVRLGGIGLRGATVVAQLYVENPNSFGLETRSLSYDLQLRDRERSDEWLPLAVGTIERKLQVDGHSERVVEIPIEFAYSDLGPALRSLLERGTFDYRVSGEVQVSEPVRRTVPYRKSGRVTLQGVK